MKDVKKEHPTSYGSAPDSTHDKYTTYLSALQEGTQNYLVLRHIIRHGGISKWEAFFDHGISNLPARIHELRDIGLKAGFEIETEMVEKKEATHHKRYAVYRLHEEA